MVQDKFLVFDVETPNAANDRICSIGISLIENNEIIHSQNIYINPECGFDLMNIRIHGINERTVLHSRIFPVVWDDIHHLFRDRVVIAHNACFDLSVLSKTLAAYGVDERTVYYIDTVQAARNIYPHLPNHKLNTLCSYLGIQLNHHDSGSDSRATAELFLNMCLHGMKIDNYVRPYQLSKHIKPTDCSSRKSRLAPESYALLELQGILAEITCDGEVDLNELNLLKDWIASHPELNGNYPYDTLYHQIEMILEDGIIEEDELAELLKVCKKLIDPINNGCSCNPPSVNVCGKNIVLSGEFSLGSKAAVESKLVSQGAVLQKNVTTKTNIVIVGNRGNAAWVAGNYGTKVKKALELQEKGVPILILKEDDCFTEG